MGLLITVNEWLKRRQYPDPGTVAKFLQSGYNIDTCRYVSALNGSSFLVPDRTVTWRNLIWYDMVGSTVTSGCVGGREEATAPRS